MSVETYQGTVENGQIKLSISVILPERAKVYVLVDDGKDSPKKTFNLAEMAANMPEDYQAREEDFGKPSGKEVW